MKELPKINLRAEVEIQTLYSQIPDARCKGLCQASCGPIGMAPYEARRVLSGAQHRRIPVELTEMGDSIGLLTDGDMTCPVLGEHGECRLYRERPLICRLWGVVESMPCPHGCRPDRTLSDEEAFDLLNAARKVVPQ